MLTFQINMKRKKSWGGWHPKAYIRGCLLRQQACRPARQLRGRQASWGAGGEKGTNRGAQVAYTVISESCSLVRFRGWLMTVMPCSSGLLASRRLARKTALWATLRKLTRACQPLLLNHTYRAETRRVRCCSSTGASATAAV